MRTHDASAQNDAHSHELHSMRCTINASGLGWEESIVKMSGAVGLEVEVTTSLLRPLHAVRSGRSLTYLPMYYDVPTDLHSDRRPLLPGDDYLETEDQEKNGKFIIN